MRDDLESARSSGTHLPASSPMGRSSKSAPSFNVDSFAPTVKSDGNEMLVNIDGISRLQVKHPAGNNRRLAFVAGWKSRERSTQ